MEKKEIRREGFDPKQYLREYFLEVDAEFDHLYNFWCRAVKALPRGGHALELGVGPSVYSTIPLAAKMDEIHLADLLEGNLQEIDAWIKKGPGHFDWRDHVKHVLIIEGIKPDPIEIERREDQLRTKIRLLRHCDLRWAQPLGVVEEFDLVTAHYCIEAAAKEKHEWAEIVKHVVALVKPGGALLLSVASGLTITRSYDGSAVEHTPLNISSKDVLDALAGAGMHVHAWELVPGMEGDPYAGSVLCFSFKPKSPVLAARLCEQNFRKSLLDGKICAAAPGHGPDTEAIIARELQNYPMLKLDKDPDGWALVVRHPIAEDTTIFHMTGKRVSEPSRYSLQIGENLHLGGDEMHVDDFIDHSCDPNCRIDVHGDYVRLISIRQIDVGEKLTFNYLTTEWDMAEPFDCKCGAKNCFRHIAGFRHLSESQKHGLEPLLTPFLKQKLKDSSKPAIANNG